MSRASAEPQDCPLCGKPSRVDYMTSSDKSRTGFSVNCTGGRKQCLRGPVRKKRSTAVNLWNRIPARK